MASLLVYLPFAAVFSFQRYHFLGPISFLHIFPCWVFIMFSLASNYWVFFVCQEPGKMTEKTDISSGELRCSWDGQLNWASLPQAGWDFLPYLTLPSPGLLPQTITTQHKWVIMLLSPHFSLLCDMVVADLDDKTKQNARACGKYQQHALGFPKLF